jgi:hypothetical protein
MYNIQYNRPKWSYCTVISAQLAEKKKASKISTFSVKVLQLTENMLDYHQWSTKTFAEISSING